MGLRSSDHCLFLPSIKVQTAYDGLPPMLKAMTAQDKTGEDDFGHQADAQTESVHIFSQPCTCY